MRCVAARSLFLLSTALCFIAASAVAAGTPFRMSADLPELEPRESWQQSLDDLAALGVPQSWLIAGPLADPGRKQFEQRGSLPAERGDDWGALKTTLWTRPQDDEGCDVDLSETLGRNRDVLVFARTEVDWPVSGPALIWFHASARAVVYVNNVKVEYLDPQKNRRERGPPTLQPIPVQMERGANIIKLKLAHGEERRGGMEFQLRLERNDLPYREQLVKRLRGLYPDEAAGWRGVEAWMELARRYEDAGKAEQALAYYQRVSDTFAGNDDYAAEAGEARRRLQAAPGAAGESASVVWRKAEEQFRTFANDAETVAADALLRGFIARFPFAPDTGTALCYRGALRQDYGLSRACQPFFERALREFPQNEAVRKYASRGVMFARNYRPETAEVPVSHERQLLVDAVRRQLNSGGAADAEAAVRTVDKLMRGGGDALLRVSDSAFTPRYAGLREYLRALLSHLAGEALAQYRKAMARGAEERYQAARAAGSVLDLEAMAWEHYLTAAAAKALNHAGNLYLDSGAYAQAAAAFRLLLRDYRTADGGDTAALLGGISAPMVYAKLARSQMGDGQVSAARETISRARGEYAAAQVRIAGRLTTAGDYVSSLESRITWAALGAHKDIVAAETETHAGNARRTGASPLTPAPKPGALAWSAPMSRSASSEMAMHFWPEDNAYPHWQPFPVVAAGRVFASTFESIQSLDSLSGQVVWKQNWNSSGGLWSDKFTGFPISCPTATAERVYMRVLCGGQSALRCYSAADGKPLWSTDANAGLKKAVWLSDPLIASGLAVAVFLEEPQGDVVLGRGAHNVHGVAAFDAETGDLRWKRALGTGITGIRVCEEVRGHDNKQYAAYRGSMQLGPPAADGGIIYAATGLGSLAALNAFTGEVLWLTEYPRLRSDDLKNGNSGALPFLPRMLKINARGPCSPIVGDEVVVLAPKDAAGVFAFERKDGRIRWSQELLDSRFLVGLCDGTVIVADNTISAISVATGRTVWEFPLEKRLLGQPGYSGGIVYSPTQAGVQLVDAHTGKALESVAWDKKIGALANLVVTGQRIVGVNAKYVAALNAR